MAGGEYTIAFARGNRRRVRELNQRNCLTGLICCPILVVIIVLCIFFEAAIKPSCSLDQFYIPALNKTLNSPNDTFIIFSVKLKNYDEDTMYYDNINVTFYDSPNRNHSIGNFTIPKFKQGNGKTATKGGAVDASGLDRDAAFRAISANGSAVFRVDLATRVKYQVWFVKGKKKSTVKVGANVEVNEQGTQVESKDIKLKSRAANKLIGFNFCGKLGAFMPSFLVFAV